MRFALSVLLALVLPAGPAAADQASRLSRQGRQAERRGDDLEAFALYTRAAGLRPADGKYRQLAERVRLRAAQNLAATGNWKAASVLEPGNHYWLARAEAVEHQDGARDGPTALEILEAERLAEPIRLRPAAGARNFDLRGDARALFEQVLRAFDLQVVFDSEFTAGSSSRFRLDQADFSQAARALLAVTGSFMVPVADRVVLVAKDTQQKRNELDPVMVTRLPLTHVTTVEEANEMGRAVQQALDIKRLTVDATRRQVLVRDSVGKVRLAQLLYEELSRRRGEVVLDVDLVAASRSSLVNFGLTLPAEFPVSNLSTAGNNRPESGPGPLLGFGGGDSLFGVRIGSGRLEADWTRSQTQLLQSIRLRATDNMAATMHIGDKFPVINALFSPVAITPDIRQLQESGQYQQPFPSFSFEDLGLVLKVTPRIHTSREVSLAIEAEFKLLTGASSNGVPVIANRKFISAVRLKEGESGLVSGLALLRVTRSASGLAGLSRIPLLGRLFRSGNWQREENELLVTITPRVAHLPPGEQVFSRTYATGAESRPLPPF